MGCCGSRIVNEGEVLGVWRKGTLDIFPGPGKAPVGCGDSIEILRSVSCGEKQYLVVNFKDGRTDHIRGPMSIILNPTKHANIFVKDCDSIGAGELMVVNRKRPGDDGSVEGQVQQLIIRGPALHMPTPDEWSHEFVWHGSDPSNPNKKKPGQLRFTKLRCIPSQMYVDIPEVRTKDDTLIVVKLMVFFELVDVDTLLQRSHDPIADFINSSSADIIAFAAVLTYEEFLEKTELLNAIETYQSLVSRAKSIGFRISKVVYRGYQSTDKLQAMHDDAIHSRTELRLQAETEEQAQRLADMKLGKEAERQKRKQEMQRSEIEHNNLLDRIRHEEKMAQEAKTKEVALSAEKAINEEQLAYYKNLKALGVDLTQYLVSQYQHPSKLIQVTTDNPSNVHVHANGPKK